MTEKLTSELLPVRMLNEYAYCPRLFHFMHVEGRWADNAYTIEGKAVHKRVDQIDHVLPDAPVNGKSKGASEEDGGDAPPDIARSVPLASESIGITAKLDLVSIADDKRRSKVFKTLHGYGDRVQYSVFFCEMNQRELIELRTTLTDHIHNAEDQVIILDLGAGRMSIERALECIGKSYEPPLRIIVV